MCRAGHSPWFKLVARVAELADAQDLGSCGETRGGSSPPSRTKKSKGVTAAEVHFPFQRHNARVSDADGIIKTTLETPESWKRVVKVEISREFFDKEYAGRLKKAVKSPSEAGVPQGPHASGHGGEGNGPHAAHGRHRGPGAPGLDDRRHRAQAGNPITEPALENLDFEDDSPLTFDLVVEVRPEIESVDFEGFPVKKREVAVDRRGTERGPGPVAREQGPFRDRRARGRRRRPGHPGPDPRG